MLVKDLMQIQGMVLHNKINKNQKIEDFYACDLLSWIAGHIHCENTALITINSSFTVIAVASLFNIPCIIFCDNVLPKQELIDKAIEENITLFTYPFSSYLLMKEICKNEI